jgi:hypothetical protein
LPRIARRVLVKRTDPLEDALARVGVRLEKKPDVHPVTQMLASGLGGIVGGELGALAGLGLLGKALSSLAGAVVGHVASSYNVRLVRPADAAAPSEPMAWSDRR